MLWSPRRAAAPRLDLQFMCTLLEYAAVEAKASAAACKKFAGHLWYLSRWLAGLALLDDEVSVLEKREMVKRLSVSFGTNT